MSRGVRTTVYVDPDLYVMAKSENLNISEIVNYGIAGILGFEYGRDRDLLRQRTREMTTKLREKFIEERTRIEEEVLASERAKVEEQVRADQQVRKQEIVHEVIMDILKDPKSHIKRLPEQDPHYDYIEWWQARADEVSARAAVHVSTSELQQFVRQNIGRYA